METRLSRTKLSPNPSTSPPPGQSGISPSVSPRKSPACLDQVRLGIETSVTNDANIRCSDSSNSSCNANSSSSSSSSSNNSSSSRSSSSNNSSSVSSCNKGNNANSSSRSSCNTSSKAIITGGSSSNNSSSVSNRNANNNVNSSSSSSSSSSSNGSRDTKTEVIEAFDDLNLRTTTTDIEQWRKPKTKENEKGGIYNKNEGSGSESWSESGSGSGSWSGLGLGNKDSNVKIITAFGDPTAKQYTGIRSDGYQSTILSLFTSTKTTTTTTTTTATTTGTGKSTSKTARNPTQQQKTSSDSTHYDGVESSSDSVTAGVAMTTKTATKSISNIGRSTYTKSSKKYTVPSKNDCVADVSRVLSHNNDKDHINSDKKTKVDSEREKKSKTPKRNKESETSTKMSDVRNLTSLSTSSLEEASDDVGVTWRFLGDVETLRRSKCRRLYARTGRAGDVALFYRQGKFYAMSAWCSHMGGPLYEGDIEDYKGKLHVMCPWHAYMFDVDTGRSDIGLEQDVFPVKMDDGNLFVLYSTDLSLNPFLSL